MEILLKHVTLKIRKYYKRSGEIAKLTRQTSVLQRNKLVSLKPVLETSLLSKKTSLQCLGATIVTYPVPGKNTVEQISYAEPLQDNGKGLVWINQAQYFENVPPSVWNFCVGNYCICQKWLTLRKGTILDRQNIQDYQRLVMLISETIDLMNNVDSQLITSSSSSSLN
jgi:Type ISP C-terminal specificity domain